MTEAPARRRSVRFDFSEPRSIHELEGLCGPDRLAKVSGAEVEILLGWTRSRLRNHHKNHPNQPPRPLPKPKASEKEWNAYFLIDVVAVLKQERAWRDQQDEVRLQRASNIKAPAAKSSKQRTATPMERREQQARALNDAMKDWGRLSLMSSWINRAALHDEWPMIRRASGGWQDFMEGLGTLQRGDQVAWQSLEMILTNLQKHRAG
jgi:hypothetical protein